MVNIVLDGDSISAGQGVPADQSPTAQLARMLGAQSAVVSVAASGRPVRDCDRLFDELVRPRYDGRAQANIIAFHAGDNDIAQGGDAGTAYGYFTNYVAKAHRQGWRVIASTELSRPDFAPAMQAELAKYNRLLKENRAGANGVIEYDGVPAMADHLNPTIFGPDRIHPAQAGYGILAAMLKTSIEKLVPMPRDKAAR